MIVALWGMAREFSLHYLLLQKFHHGDRVESLFRIEPTSYFDAVGKGACEWCLSSHSANIELLV